MPQTTAQPTKKPDGTVIFTLSIPKETVAREYQNVLQDAIKTAEVSGFRKGKAPAQIVEEKIGKQKLYTEVLKHVLPEAYTQKVKELQLKPIANPKIEPQNLDEGKDWSLTVTIAEKPQFSLGNYRKSVSDALASTKIWVPGKAEPSPQPGESEQSKNSHTQPSTDEKLTKVFVGLLSSIPITLPEILVEDALTHSLSHLIDQLQRLGLTLDQYLASLGKTSQQLHAEYRGRAEEELKLELILNEIGNDLGITVKGDEIDQLINAVGDEKLRDRLKTPEQRPSIAVSLRKRKIIDALLKM